MRPDDPLWVTSFPPSRHVAPRADIRPMPACMSTRPYLVTVSSARVASLGPVALGAGFPCSFARSSLARLSSLHRSDCGMHPQCQRLETESNIEWLDPVSTPAAADWDASFTVKCINL